MVQILFVAAANPHCFHLAVIVGALHNQFVCPTATMKTLKCKPSANCACAILLIDGLGYFYAFTRGLPLVARGESDTG